MPRNLSLQGALSAPFASPTKNAPETPKETSLEERIAQLTETLYQMDMDGRPVQRLFKLFITQPRSKLRGSFDKGCNGHGRCLSHPYG